MESKMKIGEAMSAKRGYQTDAGQSFQANRNSRAKTVLSVRGISYWI